MHSSNSPMRMHSKTPTNLPRLSHHRRRLQSCKPCDFDRRIPFSTARSRRRLKLKAFRKFDDMDEGLAATAALVKSKLHKTLQKFLEKNIVKKNLQVPSNLIPMRVPGCL